MSDPRVAVSDSRVAVSNSRIVESHRYDVCAIIYFGIAVVKGYICALHPTPEGQNIIILSLLVQNYNFLSHWHRWKDKDRSNNFRG